jgi:hypothetical protein
MAHYAFLNEDNIVVQVIVGVDETEDIEGLDPEIWYGNLKGLTCKRTSYNSKIRGTYAGIGYSYDEDENIFIAPKPFASWIRVGSFWEPPIPHPLDGKYNWDEELGNWVEALAE